MSRSISISSVQSSWKCSLRKGRLVSWKSIKTCCNSMANNFLSVAFFVGHFSASRYLRTWTYNSTLRVIKMCRRRGNFSVSSCRPINERGQSGNWDHGDDRHNRWLLPRWHLVQSYRLASACNPVYIKFQILEVLTVFLLNCRLRGRSGS